MTTQEAKDFIKAHPEQYLNRDKSGRGYICPICGSGSGSKGTGMTATEDRQHFTCWAGGCFTSADIIDIIGLKEAGINPKDKARFPEKLEIAAKLYGITIDGQRSGYTAPKKPKKEEAPQPEADYTKLYEEWNKHLPETTYYRGIKFDTLNRFQVGYCAEWKHPKHPEKPATARLIIPTSKSSYLARATKAAEQKVPKGLEKMKVGSVHIFNAAALYQEQPAFIVEGEIDALSIIDNGGQAVAAGGTSGASMLLDELKAAKAEGKATATLILALDNDSAGKTAAETLEAGLKALEAPYNKATYPEGIKDANEYLQKDKAGFRQFIIQAEEAARKAGEDQAADAERELNELRAQLQTESAAAYGREFMAFIKGKEHHTFVKTGFVTLDSALDGGIYPGLSILGAISSLGKTTFALQIADNIASQGRSVLFFSLEMAKTELIAKSISRITFETAKDKQNAKTTRGILLHGQKYGNYTPEEEILVNTSIDAYFQRIAPKMYIYEGTADIGIEQIADQLKRHTAAAGEAPVVIVDYLQILKPESDRLTDKQATDRAVLALKRLSRDYNTQIIAISSFNRSSYTEPLQISAFKESGAIEYGSDYCFGLQFAGMDYQGSENERERAQRVQALKRENNEKAKSGQPQQIECEILKNRNGRKDTIPLELYAKFNTYIDAPKRTRRP